MTDPHFPKPQPKPEAKHVPIAARVDRHVVVSRPEPPSEQEGAKAKLTSEEVQALLTTTKTHVGEGSKWVRSGKRATSFIVLAVLGAALDSFAGFLTSTIITTVLGVAMLTWTIRPLWQKSEWD